MANSILWLADNINFLKSKVDNESVDLVYIDPPFNSKRNYNIVFDTETNSTEQAFTDIWSNVSYLEELEQIEVVNNSLYSFLKLLEGTQLPKSYLSYLTAMAIRCYFIRETLKETGSFYYHCDPTMSHYIKVMLDYIFGRENFRNEIVWCYTGPSSPGMTVFARKHDTIFRYSKTYTYTWNVDAVRLPYAETSKSALRSPSKLGGERTKYLSTAGKYPEDWWIDIPALKNTAERLGYPTQKPEALLERIIKVSSNEGDTVADYYLGGGTTVAVAQRLNRKSIGVDINYRAIQMTKDRLIEAGYVLKKDFIIKGIPNSSKELRLMLEQNLIGSEKDSNFELEDVIIKYYLNDVVGNSNKRGDGSVDGRYQFTSNGKVQTGLVQVTAGKNLNHFKAFCSTVQDGTQGSVGTYITFKDKITDSMILYAKNLGKVGGVDKVQILTIEEIVDKKKQINKPV